MTNKVIVIVGAGPGLGSAVARAFGSQGYDVALVARNPEKLEALRTSLQELGITTGWSAADVTDSKALAAAVERFGGHAGHIDALHFNPSIFTPKSAAELSAEELLSDLAGGAAAILTAAQAARPFMSAGSVILATGSINADRPWTTVASLGVQKAALRNLVTALDQSLRSEGIRAASVTINGTLAEDTEFAPDRIAEVFVKLAERARTAGQDWQTVVPYPA